MIKKLGRNDHCWCGSGKKYKACHEAFDDKLRYLEDMGHIIPPHKIIKTPEQIEKIKESARINVACLDAVAAAIHEGMNTAEIDKIVYDVTTDMGGIPAPLNYEGYPYSVCTSVNEQVCHGFPSKDVILKSGDIVNVDATTMLNGYYAVGKVSNEAKKLVSDTKKALELGMASVIPYQSCVGDIGKAIETFAKAMGYSVVREFCGHGVGLAIHEDPYVFHFEPNAPTVTLVPGMVFTIEPMLNLGGREVYVDESDEWTVYTDDESLSAQWEHTLLVTEDGIEIISK